MVDHSVHLFITKLFNRLSNMRSNHWRLRIFKKFWLNNKELWALLVMVGMWSIKKHIFLKSDLLNFEQFSLHLLADLTALRHSFMCGRIPVFYTLTLNQNTLFNVKGSLVLLLKNQYSSQTWVVSYLVSNKHIGRQQEPDILDQSKTKCLCALEKMEPEKSVLLCFCWMLKQAMKVHVNQRNLVPLGLFWRFLLSLVVRNTLPPSLIVCFSLKDEVEQCIL